MVHYRDTYGRPRGIPPQVVSVERPLVSVSRMAAAGCKVSFLEDRLGGPPCGAGAALAVGAAERGLRLWS